MRLYTGGHLKIDTGLVVQFHSENAQTEQMQLEERLRGEYIFNEIRERLEYKARALEQETMVQRRLMKAFPGLRSKRFDKELQEMRAQMEARKRKRKQQKGERK